MNETVTNCDGAGTTKKPRLAECEIKHVVSMRMLVRACEHGALACLIPVVAVQGGEQLCRIECRPSLSISELKSKVGERSELDASILAIYLVGEERPLGENVTLEGCGLPSELYAVMLWKVNIAELVSVPSHELTDEQLVEACLTDEGKGWDIVTLTGCRRLRNMTCLEGLVQMQQIDISGCDHIAAATTVASVIAEHK
jgi:hypothetical protein